MKEASSAERRSLLLRSLPWLTALLLLTAGASRGLPAASRLSDEPHPNLVRYPYLQDVTTSAAQIIWTTAVSGTASVRWSTDGENGSVSAAVSTYRALPAWPRFYSYYVHVVTLSDLQPDTIYRYQVLLDGVDLTPGTELTLRTAPPSSQSWFTFLALGDTRGGSRSQQAVRDVLLQQPASLVLHNGDLGNYGSYAELEAEVFAMYGQSMARVPWWFAPGNHDYASGALAPYLDVFYLPENAWRVADRERYYAFDWGNVHFVVLDTNRPLWQISDAAADDLRDWLIADLAASGAFWRVVVMHHPPYSAGTHGSTPEVIERLVDVFEAYGVDLVIAGHDHAYERSYPVRNGALADGTEQGVIYLVSGGGGAPLYPVRSGWWTAYSRSTYQFVRADVAGCRMRLYAVDSRGEIFDETEINRCDEGGELVIALSAASVRMRQPLGLSIRVTSACSFPEGLSDQAAARVTVRLTSPTGRAYQVPGAFVPPQDPKDSPLWRARLLPAEVGVWRYEVELFAPSGCTAWASGGFVVTPRPGLRML